MPKDNIERAIKRGAGEVDGADYQEIRYEGYGPGGTAVMVDCLTDNRNRTVAEVRHAFTKYGGNLGADGSVNYLFNQVGQLLFPAGSDEESRSWKPRLRQVPKMSLRRRTARSKCLTVARRFRACA